LSRSESRRPSIAARDLDQVRAIGRAIRAWGTAGGFGSRRPDLPWRSSRDPWAILVSEVMAQQTQVSRVASVYLRFLDAFPTPAACAAASLGEVLRAWKGLGYNRRAANLHRCASAVVADHRGVIPPDIDGLLALPGVGPYTARAVVAFAYEQDVGVVDTNAGRVVARALAGRAVTPKEAQQLVDAMVPAGGGWEFNQALLDLGATVCTAGAPRCSECPIRRRCRWAARGLTLPDPASGSAGVSTRQSAFHGSDRQGRGRLMDALREGMVRSDQVPDAAGWPDDPERAHLVAAQLIDEGLVIRNRVGTLRLP
jgi:A/G-specific adenine glycosylase